MTSDYDLLTWEDIRREMSLKFLEVGSHGLEHEPLTTCRDEELEKELRESRSLIEQRIGTSVQAVAFPNGNYSPQVIAAARDTGYRIGFSTLPFHVRGDSSEMSLPRLLIGAHDSPRVLAARLSGWQEWIRHGRESA